MSEMEKVLYTAKAHTVGGRDGGGSRTSDGRLDVKLSVPGTAGTGTNPEQLFAVGWSACYLSAVRILAAQRKIALSPKAAVDIEVDLVQQAGLYRLQARMTVRLPQVDPGVARELTEAAHGICPYSRAIHGNIDVTTTVDSEASITDAA